MVKKEIIRSTLTVIFVLVSFMAVGQIELNIPGKYDTLFFETGEVKILRQLAGNVVDGEFIEFYKNGNTRFHAKYKNGVLNGFANAWYEEKNKIAYKGKFSYGRELEMEYFLPSGDKTTRENFLSYMDSIN